MHSQDDTSREINSLERSRGCYLEEHTHKRALSAVHVVIFELNNGWCGQRGWNILPLSSTSQMEFQRDYLNPFCSLVVPSYL